MARGNGPGARTQLPDDEAGSRKPPRQEATSASLNPAEITRYARQISLEDWGRGAQERLKSSQVLIAGAGGVAGVAAAYLLASGVGGVRLVDASRVNLSDLNHQIIFRECDLGKRKAQVAQQRLREINSLGTVESHVKTVSGHNLGHLTAGCQLLLDASSNAATAHLLNQAAVKFRLPLVHAWVWGSNGRIATFYPGQGPCLACSPLEIGAAAPQALLGPLPGIMGALQALEAMRLLAGLGSALLGRMLTFRGNQFQFLEKPLKTDPQCPVCRGVL